jgi:hypothetical protein
MQILKGLPSFPPELRPSVAALGAFVVFHLSEVKLLVSLLYGV